MLRADSTGSLLNAIENREPASVTPLAAATDRTPSTVSHHLTVLEERGLIERERTGQSVVTTLSKGIRGTMLELGGVERADG